MTDLALIPDAQGRYDIAFDDEGDLVTTDDLGTAVLLSLLVDRRAERGDEVPDGTGDRRGYWADMLLADGDRHGSGLWLLEREKAVQSVRDRAERYAREALQWIVDDGIADDVLITAETAEPGILQLSIEVRRGDRDAVTYRYQYVWESAT